MGIEGHAEPGFQAVRDVFEGQFGGKDNVGGGVSIYHRGREVVNLWAGTMDEEGTRPWAEDTMTIVYSTSKGITATCVHILADRGLIDYEKPVATYWPEFAQAGKERITVRQLLSHRAGMSVNPPELDAADYVDWDRVVSALAAMAPAWEPGTAAGYHALSFGFLAGELVRRVSGKSVGTFLREEVCGPLGLQNMYIGAPASAEPRIAPLWQRFEVDPAAFESLFSDDGQSVPRRSLSPASGDIGTLLNSPAGHQAEIPAVSCVTTARDLARLYGCLAVGGELDGVRLLRKESIDRATEPQSFEADLVIQIPIRWSLGYMNGAEGWPQGPRPNAFGHPGFGGSTGFADPEIELGFGYVPNAMHLGLTGAGRASSLAEAARACIAALS